MNADCDFEAPALVGRKGTWRVVGDASTLSLTSLDNDEAIQIPRVDVKQVIEVRDLFFGGPILIVRIPKDRVVLKLEKAQALLLREWLGPQTIGDLNKALKRRLKAFIPHGILLVVSSLPLPANPDTGVEAVPFDAISAFLGFAFLTSSILGLFWPRRILFCVDGILFLLIALNVLVGIIGGDSLWWSLAVILLILGSQGCYFEYQRFDKLSDD